MCVYPLSDLHLLENPKAKISLQQSLQGRLQSPVPTFLDVIRPKIDQMYHFLPDSPTSTRRTSPTPAYTRLAERVSLYCALPAPTHLPCQTSPVPTHPTILLTPTFTLLYLYPFHPSYTVCTNPTTSVLRSL